jgi:muramoyltetrapeptide carboxypeptidase
LEADSILLLKGVGEAEFRLGRSFQQLIDSIELDLLQEVCLSVSENCDLTDGIRSLTAIFSEWIEDVPIYSGLPVSHRYKNLVWRCNDRRSTGTDKLELITAFALIESE